jgi:hypothetical protein
MSQATALKTTRYGTYATAIALATIGATVSLSGLVAMFGLAFLPIGLGLEVAKLVAARRLHQGNLTTGLRATLFALVTVCMAVTTIGVYGFISRAYADRVATMTRTTDHALADTGERIKIAEQSVAGIDQQLARIDAPETRTVKVQVRGRTTETTVPVMKDKAARPSLEGRRAKAAAELADLRVELAGHQAEHAHVEAEINTIRAIASVVGLTNDPVLAVNILAGILAVMWDPFAVLLLLASARRGDEPKPVSAPVAKPISKRARKPGKAKRKAALSPTWRSSNDNVIPYPRPA